jgi:hypothetical protein
MKGCKEANIKSKRITARKCFVNTNAYLNFKIKKELDKDANTGTNGTIRLDQ